MTFRSYEPFHRMHRRQVIALATVLLSGSVAGTCLAQEDDLFRDALDEVVTKAANGEDRDASPQEEAAHAAEEARRRQEELLGRRQEQMAVERARAEQEHRRALEQYQQVQQQLGQSHPQMHQLEQQLQQLEAKRHELSQQMAMLREAEEMANREQPRNAPPLKDGTLKIFSLRSTRAPDAARLLGEILGPEIARMAIDERTNSLILYANEEKLELVSAVLSNLDRPATKDSQRPGETLQLRMVWLLDIDEGMKPNDRLISDHVFEALQELGFTSPKVICQQVTTLALSDDGARRGQFNFAVPVLVKSQPWQFEGQGQIEAMADDRFNLRFDLRFQQRDVNTSRFGGGRGSNSGQQGQLGGSINTPLGHYTVMGTTTLIASHDPPKGEEGPQHQQQHLSAFVVYVDRAREFPAPSASSNNRSDNRR